MRHLFELAEGALDNDAGFGTERVELPLFLICGISESHEKP